ncbi:cytochrome-c oxidase, cbb3-type subunit II, partial [Pseudomonas sp. NPDC089554]
MKHEAVEKNIGLLAFFMVIAVSVGGLTQIVPLFFQDVTNKPVEGMTTVYSTRAIPPRRCGSSSTCASLSSVRARR